MRPEIDEHLIEVYVRAPAALTPCERDDVEDALRRSPRLRAVAAYWRAYYRTLGDLPPEPPGLDAFVDRLLEPPDDPAA